MTTIRVCLAGVVLLAVGCARPNAPAMTPRADARLPEATPGQGRVVLVRKSSGCDTSDDAIVVNESGEFLGALAPDTAFALELPPGRHALFVWPELDLRSEKLPNFHPVGVTEVSVEAGATRVLPVTVVPSRAGRGHCYRYSMFQFEKPSDGLAAIAGARVVDADRQAGAAFMQRHRETNDGYLAMARERLEQRRSRLARDSTTETTAP